MAARISILITGSNQGLGFEAARHLSRLPNVLLFISGRNSTSLDEAYEKLTKAEDSKAQVNKILLELTDDESINSAFKKVTSVLGNDGLDVLVVSVSNLKLI
jgi:NAD(P)-dependent dehydrogenase (short-subunit alcohol dehydrogenase family)